VTLLTQSLNHFRDANPHLRDWNDKLATYKRKGVVRMGLCRKVFTHIYQMLKKDEPHHFADLVSQKKKMQAYRLLLRSYGILPGGGLQNSA
jgi:transposase